MANPATTARTQGQGNEQGQPQAVVPFIRASAKHRERFHDQTKTVTTSDQDLGVIDVPAFGFMRSVLLHVTASGGDAGASTVAADPDAPFSVLKNVTLSEPNGATITAWNKGHDLYVAHKYGGYRFRQDPRKAGFTDVDAGGNFEFFVRVPVELNQRSGIGSLPNQNSSATYKLGLTVSKASDIYGTSPDTLPDVRVRAWLESWEQPQRQSAGMVNAVVPPAVNTTQYWSPQTFNVNSGEQGVRLTRMGNYLRNLVFVTRDTNGARSNNIIPDLTTFFLDARPLDQLQHEQWRVQMYERYGYEEGSLDTAGNQDTGVYVYDFAHEFTGQVGHENRDLWLETLGSTRFEVQGQFGAGGIMHVYTNDVSVAGVVFT